MDIDKSIPIADSHELEKPVQYTTTNPISAPLRKRKENDAAKTEEAPKHPTGKIFAQFITRDGEKTGTIRNFLFLKSVADLYRSRTSV